ncbi:MAG: hypothetical protein JKX70_04470 [Phycisphaerales bacterium]|nr:hypothetical protein [Phycisphaerales bacterium]
MSIQHITCTALIALTGIQAAAGERDVQFRFVFPPSQRLIIFNTGTEPIDLAGWRFCSHNSTQVRQYTNPSAFNGVTIEPWEGIRVHLNNDADPDDPTQFNASDLGNFADFELEAYGLSLYFPNDQGVTPFSDGNFIADHLQWSLGGVDNTTADERSDEAQEGGVWADQSEWISVRNDTLLIELVIIGPSQMHSPSDYALVHSCTADITDDGQLNFFDVSAFLGAFVAMEPAADFTGDGMFNFFDVSSFLSLFAAGCP